MVAIKSNCYINKNIDWVSYKYYRISIKFPYLLHSNFN